MNYLFFFVHPSKFYVFKNTINTLKSRGHKVDVLITSKDILEDLVKKERWEYKNIFPEGRKIKGLLPIVSSGINLPRTIYRLYKYCRNKKYDLFITDDLLVFLSKWFKVPNIIFTDDDISVTKQFSIILSRATYVLAPEITDLGKYNAKKIGFSGYKELAYLHFDEFQPDINIIKSFNLTLSPYFLLRLVSLRAYHDVGIQGLSNERVKRIVSLLKAKGKVFISSERELPDELEKYRLNLSPELISHALYYAQIFVGDSQTMTSEAAVLGTPAFRCNDFAGKINVMEEKEIKYELSFNYSPSHFDDMYKKIKELLSKENIKSEFENKREKMLKDKINLSRFMIWLFENYPRSVEIIKKNPSETQDRFR